MEQWLLLGEERNMYQSHIFTARKLLNVFFQKNIFLAIFIVIYKAWMLTIQIKKQQFYKNTNYFFLFSSHTAVYLDWIKILLCSQTSRDALFFYWSQWRMSRSSVVPIICLKRILHNKWKWFYYLHFIQ
jgi:hypothetical protein